MADSDPAELAKGHRARLRARLLAEPDGLLDHELVEYLLMTAMPRVDTKPIAKRALARFEGLIGVFQAEPDALMQVEGMGEAGVAAIRLVRTKAQAAPVLANWQALSDYLHAAHAHDTIEVFRVLHLNSRNMLVRDEAMSRGTIDEAAVHVREVVKRALEIGSAALILVHNHPSGDPSPSRADIEITKRIVEAGRVLGIAVHDHIIVGSAGQVSLRAKGLI